MPNTGIFPTIFSSAIISETQSAGFPGPFDKNTQSKFPLKIALGSTFAGKTENKVMDIVSKPGLWLQSLTTKNPEDSMLEVAIVSVEAVFDWKKFLAEDEKENVVEKVEENAAEKAEEAAVTKEKKKEPVKEKKKGAAKQAAKEKKKEPVKDTGFEVVDVNDDEDDEILQALDRYFEDPTKAKADNTTKVEKGTE